ncbi:MAG: hypothetical protein P3T54_06855 [Dehalogenimonas sp.]|uniref:Histone n=1 Tax=Candidatus Dehalogenimonas loeffleri TaxID=3127115 RepID=A0ABZ2J437_9CHLR|nr:hypothetical protein [Dehalogenimonas sp.]
MNKKRRVAQHKQKIRKEALKEKARALRLAETGGKVTPAPARTRYEIEETPEAAVKTTKTKAAPKAKAETTAAATKPATKAAAKPKATPKAKAETEAAAEDKPKKAVKKAVKKVDAE